MKISFSRMEMLLPKEGDVCGPKFLEPYRDGKLLYPAWIDGSALYHEEMLECIRKMDEALRCSGPRAILWR